MADRTNRLRDLLNQETPFAATTQAEIDRRLSTNSTGSLPLRPSSQEKEPPAGDSVLNASGEPMASRIDPATQVFVPAHPVLQDGEQLAQYELREVSEGSPALPAFTSIEHLTAQLGRFQPWLKVPLRQLLNVDGVDRVAIDPTIDPHAWRWTAEELQKFSDEFTKLCQPREAK